MKKLSNVFFLIVILLFLCGTFSYTIPQTSRTGINQISTPHMTQYVNTYYIFSFDGKLLAEYDDNDNCVKEYIYVGSKLLAEFNPQTGKYYYYTTDQINSTRIVTNDNGDVVYSAAHGPYGGMQKIWAKSVNPHPEFSGKERENQTQLDYFGARYYDHSSARFISVDPIINKADALANPQLWNLYSYCRNNPITFMDPDGMVEGSFNWLGIYGPDSDRPNDQRYDHMRGANEGTSNITPGIDLTYEVHYNDDGTSRVTFNFTMNVMMWIETPLFGSSEAHIEHETAHLIQWAIVYQRRKAYLESIENVIITHNDPDWYAQNAINNALDMDVVRFGFDHNRLTNRWSYENRHRAVPTLGEGVLRYNPEDR